MLWGKNQSAKIYFFISLTNIRYKTLQHPIKKKTLDIFLVVVVVTAPIFFLHDVIWRLHSVKRSYLVTISNLGRASTKFVASTLMVGVLGEGVAEVGA